MTIAVETTGKMDLSKLRNPKLFKKNPKVFKKKPN